MWRTLRRQRWMLVASGLVAILAMASSAAAFMAARSAVRLEPELNGKALRIPGPNGAPQVIIGVDGNGTAYLVLARPNNSLGAMINAPETGVPDIMVCDGNGEPRISLGEHNDALGLWLVNARGAVIASLSTHPIQGSSQLELGHGTPVENGVLVLAPRFGQSAVIIGDHAWP